MADAPEAIPAAIPTADDTAPTKEVSSDDESEIIELPSTAELETPWISRPGYPRFMTPVDPSSEYFSQSSRGPRQPSAEVPKPYSLAPDQIIPMTPKPRSRSKSWVAAAAKSVDVFRSSKRSTNYSKRTPYKSRSKQPIPKKKSYRLVSVSQTEEPCTPRSRDSDSDTAETSSTTSSQKTITPGTFDKMLPSEKPLPSTPETKPDEDVWLSESRTIIDAEEIPLHRSPPDNPNVKEEWPILSPLKVHEKKKTNSWSTNGQPHEAKLTTIEEEIGSAVPSGVKMFSDAVTKLSYASNNNIAEVNQSYAETLCAETKPIPDNGNDAFSADIATQCHTPNSSNTCLATDSLSASAVSSEPAAITTLQLPPPTPPVVNSYTGITVMDTSSNTPKPNPFRKRPRVSSSPSSGNKMPQVEKRAFYHGVDSNTKTDQTSTGSYPNGANDTGFDLTTLFDPDGNEHGTPRHQKSTSKIPRFSPMASHFNAEDNSGTGNGVKPMAVSGGRSGIPVPSRILHKFKGNGDVVGGTPGSPNPFNPFNDTEKGGFTQFGGAKQSSETDSHAARNGASNGTDKLADGYTVRHLSTTSPSSGPKLRISPDAERVIMGDGRDSDEAENNPKENRRGGRQSGGKREFRLSADNLFGNFSSKRGKNSLSRLSFNGGPEPEPSPLAGKTISKAKSAELGGRYASSRYRMRSKTSPGNGVHHPQKNNNGTNPFFNNEPTPDSQSPAPSNVDIPKEPDSSHSQAPGTNDEASGDLVNEGAATATGNRPAQTGNVSPPKSKRPVERGTPRKTNDALKKGTPKSPRAHRNAGHGSPRKISRQSSTRQANHHKSKSGREGETASESANAQQSAVQTQKEKKLVLQNKHNRHPEDHAETMQTVKYKGSATRGVLSNFRGLFSKNKLDATNSPSLARPKRKSASKSKLNVNSTNNDNDKSVVPANDGRNTNMDIAYLSSGHPDSLALTDTGRISHLTMEILDSARREMDASRKEKLIKLGKILIEAVNHSHDAEKAMLTAIQAAKEAEVACALAKENAMKMGQVALDWTQGRNRYEELF